MNESLSIAQFWNWFESRQASFLFLNEVSAQEKDRLMNDLLEQLHAYSTGLYYEIGGHPDEDEVELIITAEGNRDYFEKVETLVDGAPVLKNWRFIKFRQAHGPGFVTEYDGTRFDPDKILFIPLIHKTNPSKIGFNVCYSELTEENRAKYLSATYILLDTLLGEKAAVCDIDFFDVVNTPQDILDYDIGHLSGIADYIRAKKEDTL